MGESIVNNPHHNLKSGGSSYQSTLESLRAKLHQSHTLADVIAKGDFTDTENFHLTWCLVDLLGAACIECDGLLSSGSA